MKKIVIGFSLLVSCLYSSAQDVTKIKIGDLQAIIANSKEQMIVNFWATYCAPCLQEIPWFEKELADHKNDHIRFLMVSLDLKDDYASIKPMANKRKFSASLAWLDESNADYFCPKIDTSWSGAIPS